MKKYLILLNVILILFVVGSSFALVPVIGKEYALGSAIGALMTGGVVTVYNMTTFAGIDDRRLIKSKFFSKSYPRELALNAVIAGLAFALYLMMRSSIFVLVTGYMFSVLAYLVIEYIYVVLMYNDRKSEDNGR